MTSDTDGPGVLRGGSGSGGDVPPGDGLGPERQRELVQERWEIEVIGRGYLGVVYEVIGHGEKGLFYWRPGKRISATVSTEERRDPDWVEQAKKAIRASQHRPEEDRK